MTLCSHAQTNHYVRQGGGHSAPFTSWTTAARDIQSAIDAAAPGATVWVTNGVYNSGGRPRAGQALTNLACIDKALTVRSVNGPSNTFIVGRWHAPGTTRYGDAAVRCAYLTNGAQLFGFTLTNGATRTGAGSDWLNERQGGGAWCEARSAVLSNCVLTANCAQHVGGGAYSGSLYSGEVIDNIAGSEGGGAWGSALYDCAVLRNYAYNRGGTSGCLMRNCLLSANSSVQFGAHRYDTFYNCEISGNSSQYDHAVLDSTLYNCLLHGNLTGGARSSSLYNCELTGNIAGGGAGASSSALYNCLVRANTAGGAGGGGAFGCALYNCTLVENTAQVYASGIRYSTNWNTVLYYSLGVNYSAGDNNIFNFSCTTPLPTSGQGNTDAAPAFLDRPGGDYRLARGSPCINTGTNFPWQVFDPDGRGRDKDLDGNNRVHLGAVDMGAYEYVPPGTMFFIRGQ